MLLVFILLYANTRSLVKTFIILLAAVFGDRSGLCCTCRAINLSVAVWVGLMALVVVDAETGLFMILYLGSGMRTPPAGRTASGDRGALGRDPPWCGQTATAKRMTVATMMLGLIAIMWSAGPAGKRIAARLFGGIVTSFVLELLVYPAIYEVWKCNSSGNMGEPSEVAIRVGARIRGQHDGRLRPRGVPRLKFTYKTPDLFLKIDR